MALNGPKFRVSIKTEKRTERNRERRSALGFLLESISGAGCAESEDAMTREDFRDMLHNDLPRMYGDEYEVEFREVQKFEETLNGVLIRSKGSNIAPTLYEEQL